MRGILFKPDMIKAIVEGRKTQTRRVAKRIRDEGYKFELSKPLYTVGGVVYIKEAWATESQFDHLKPRYIPHSAKIFYVADGMGEWPIHLTIGKRRSPLFMPAWAGRYFIRITDVRAERLQEITLEDIYDEGIDVIPSYDRIDAFKRLWDSINKPHHDWNSNPWCFVYTFQLVDKLVFQE